MSKALDLSVRIDDEEAKCLLARLEAGSRKTDTCWLWLQYRRNGHHGALSVHGHSVYVHQLSYAIHKGPIPSGRVVRHRCDVPPCWFPDHLLLGDQLTNIADMRERGRAAAPPIISGAGHHMATLTFDQVEEIRALWAAGGLKQRDLAARYSVRQSTIWRLVHRVTRASA